MEDAWRYLIAGSRTYFEMFLLGRGGEKWSSEGHFESSDSDLRKWEQYFKLNVPPCEERIYREIHDRNLSPSIAPLLLLLGWATRYETVSVVLHATIFGEHHLLHAAGLHALLPILATRPSFPRPVTVQNLVRFTEDEDANCAYRALRLTKHIPLSQEEFSELAQSKEVFQNLRRNSMHIGVQHWAEQVTLRIATGFRP